MVPEGLDGFSDGVTSRVHRGGGRPKEDRHFEGTFAVKWLDTPEYKVSTAGAFCTIPLGCNHGSRIMR